MLYNKIVSSIFCFVLVFFANQQQYLIKNFFQCKVILRNHPIIPFLQYNITHFVDSVSWTGYMAGALTVQKGICAWKTGNNLNVSCAQWKKTISNRLFFLCLWNVLPSNMTHLVINTRHKQRKTRMGGLSYIDYTQCRELMRCSESARPKGGVWCVRTTFRWVQITERGSDFDLVVDSRVFPSQPPNLHCEDNTD